MSDGEIEVDTELIYGNIARQDLQGIRSKSLRRLIALDAVVRYEYHAHHGPAYQWWSDQDGAPHSLMRIPTLE